MTNQPETQELHLIPVELKFYALVNGKPSGTEAVTVNLPVTDEQLRQHETLRWQLGVGLGDEFQRQKGMTVHASQSGYPIFLSMRSSDAWATLVSGKPAKAIVELPVTVEVDEGKELIRDGKGRPHGVVERKFCNIAWDTGWHGRQQARIRELVRSTGSFRIPRSTPHRRAAQAPRSDQGEGRSATRASSTTAEEQTARA